jgi:hypothetical protein
VEGRYVEIHIRVLLRIAAEATILVLQSLAALVDVTRHQMRGERASGTRGEDYGGETKIVVRG